MADAYRPIPVILDTDIGGDIDDTWALAMLLNCPELDPKLIVTNTHDTAYRARIVARFLTACSRTDIPIGIGKPGASHPEHATQARYADGYDLADYAGTVYEDGVGAMIDMIQAAQAPITLITIGPLGNISEALHRDPRIARATARYVGMVGSVRVGYDRGPAISRECNAGRGRCGLPQPRPFRPQTHLLQ